MSSSTAGHSPGRHAVRNTVLATLISAFLLWLASEFGPVMTELLSEYVWAPIVTAASVTWSAVTYSVGVPVWLLALLAIFPARAVVGVLQKRRAPAGPPEPRWQDYTVDYFHGLRWRWAYAGERIFDVTPFCPRDDTLLVAERDYYQMFLCCETCGERWDFRGDDARSLRGKVERQIDRKLRNENEWRAVVAAQRSST